jgi:hypothetical protein
MQGRLIRDKEVEKAKAAEESYRMHNAKIENISAMN